MAPKNIYLLRHGEVENQGSRRFIGQINIPLNHNGRLQAFRLRDHLAVVEFNYVYCSDLERSLKTALFICEKQEARPIIRKDLREISLGCWEGKSFLEIQSGQPEEFSKRGRDIVHYRPPGGESFLDCAARAVRALYEIIGSPGNNILVVGHAGLNRCIICHVLGSPLKNLFNIAQDYGCMNKLEVDGIHLKLVRINWIL